MIDPQTLIGQQLDQYRLIRHIARGGMADVYLAHDAGLNRDVALKIMLPVLAADPEFVERFQREAQTVARLDHPNIIHIYGIGDTNGRPYLAMQFIEGGSLKDTLAQVAQTGSRIDTRQALNIIGKMADALEVAHAAGIVHRDIKPSNILIRPDGAPVLVDLGIAAVQDGRKLTQTGSLVGTPDYMSPEQAGGKAVDGRSDLYSLGIILYEMLAGQRPFTAEEPMALLHHHVYETPPPLAGQRPDLTPETIHVVETCLAKSPDLRFQSAAALRRAVNQALQAEGGPGATTDAGVWEPFPSGEYRLSPSKIVPPEDDSAASPLRWLWLAVPLLLIGLVFLLFQLNPDLFTFSSDGTASTAPANTDTAVAQVTNTPTTGAQSLPAAADPTKPPLPTATFAALPTFTAVPSPSASPTPAPTATVDARPVTTEIGRSVNGQPIQAVQFGSGPQRLLFIGGFHAGFAPATVAVANLLIDYLTNNPQAIPAGATIIVIPNANPDSPSAPGQLNGRLNANGVDLNRNWDCRWTPDARWRGNVIPGSGGPEPLSEPESRALHDFIMDQPPAAVVFWEARATNGLAAPGVCGANSRVSGPLAQSYGFAAGYPVADFENLTNQELNGDATNWLDDQNIPALAILLPDYDDSDWVSNLAGIQAVIRDYGQ